MKAGQAADPRATVLLGLQRSAGNAAVTRMLEQGPRQIQRVATRGQTGALPYPAWDKPAPVREGPHYGTHDKRTGGTSVDVVLGPSVMAPANTYNGSRPQANECTLVDELLQRDGDGWVKGHLWNDNLGGPGVSKNLTPMTSAMNHHYNTGFEEPVKRMLHSCARHARAHQNAPHWYGVRIRVSTHGRMSNNPTDLEYHVPAEVDHSARYVTIDKTTGGVSGPVAVPPGFEPEQL